MLVEIGIVEESLLTAIEGGSGEGKLVGRTMIMSNLDIRLQSRAERETHVGALIIHRVLGIHTHQSTLGVHSIKGALRTTQHVDTVNLVEMTVERTLVDKGNIIIIYTHGGIARATAYASHISRGSESRTIRRNRHRGHEIRQLGDVAYIKRLQFLVGKYCARQWLAAQFHAFLGLSHYNNLVEVIHLCRIDTLNGICTYKREQEQCSQKEIFTNHI